MKICVDLDITFVSPCFIIQDASYAEANAAFAVFGSTVTILMCWFHLVFNVKKHESLAKVNQGLREMVRTDLTRLHYCLEYEYEPFKAIVIHKWKSHPELDDFVKYVIPQWFEGSFTNWHIWKSPPGFANTNNPMESFNKLIKALFTNYEEQPLIAFIRIIIDHIIPFYSINTREFLFYRVPLKKTITLAKTLDTNKFEVAETTVNVCTFKGKEHTHTINFENKSCTCRWFMAFAVCAHLIAACDFYNHELKGYRQAKVFVYKRKRGRKAKALTFTDMAFRANPMPVIALPITLPDQRPSLFEIPLPIINSATTAVEPPAVSAEPSTVSAEPPTVSTEVTASTSERITRPKRPVLIIAKAKEKVKRLKSTPIIEPALSVDEVAPKRGPGRPRKVKVAPALSE